MYQGMTEKHINFDLSKTDNVDADVNQVNEQNILCNFCGTLLIEHGTAVKQSHHVSLLFDQYFIIFTSHFYNCKN